MSFEVTPQFTSTNRTDEMSSGKKVQLTPPKPPTAILHTIFFLRYFPAILPQTRDFLGVEVAYVPDDQIETLIDQRATALVRQLDAERHQNSRNAGSYNSGSRGQITVQFLEKRRKKTWLPIRAGDDEIPWESWTIKVTVSEPRTEGGSYSHLPIFLRYSSTVFCPCWPFPKLTFSTMQNVSKSAKQQSPPSRTR